MRLPDLWTGLAIVALGLFAILQAQGFPEPAGAASPRLFPRIIGAAFVICGLAVAARGLTKGKAALIPPGETWMRHPKQVARVAFVPLAIIAYGLLAPVAGSLAVSLVLVFITALLWNERPLGATLSALIVCIVATLFFTRVMRVPLPAGPLDLF
jgi:putative tricarboxylic transport membrane protein